MKNKRRGITLYNVQYNVQLQAYELLEAGKLYQMDMFMLDALKIHSRQSGQQNKTFVADWYRSLPPDQRKKVTVLQPSK